MSMTMSSSTCSCLLRSASTRSRTIILTLLSLSLTIRSMKHVAAALTAAGFWVKVVKVVAASYLTECEGESRSSEMIRT